MTNDKRDLLNFTLPDGTPFMEHVERTLGTADDNGEGIDRSEDAVTFDVLLNHGGLDVALTFEGVPSEDGIFALLVWYRTPEDIAEAAVKLLKILAVKDAGYGYTAALFWNWRRGMVNAEITAHQMSLRIIAEKGHDSLADCPWWRAVKRAIRADKPSFFETPKRHGTSNILALLLEAM